VLGPPAHRGWCLSSSSDPSENEGRRGKGSKKTRRKAKKLRRESTQVEIELMAQSHKAELAMNEAKRIRRSSCRRTAIKSSVIELPGTAHPLIDGTAHLARKSLRLFLVDAELGGPWKCGLHTGDTSSSRLLFDRV
jgi:hypothetical protein